MKYKVFILALFVASALICGCVKNVEHVNATNANASQPGGQNLNDSLKSALVASHISSSNITLSENLSSVIIPRVNKFSLKLLRVLNGERNEFFSPLSIEFAFATLSEGAAGKTKVEMLKALDLPKNDKIRRESFLYLYRVENKQNLSLANALWIKKNYPIKESYINVIEKYYPAEIYSVDFYNPITVKLINHWVNVKTHGKIKSIVNKIDKTTRLVITNAIYFKGKWEYPFDKNYTKPMDFHTNNKTVKVEMMHKVLTCPYIEGKDYKAIELAYKGGYSMIVFLPTSNTTNLTVLENFSSFVESMKPCRVEVYLPKFSYRTEYSLIKPMEELGMKDAFTSNANFSNISNENLYVGTALHKAYINVNENGTVAAAVTYVGVMATCVPHLPKPKVFKADRPFLFFIVDKVGNKDLILFAGKVVNPKI